MTGKIIFRKNYSDYAGRDIIITDFQQREQGIYFLKVVNASGVRVRKIIKLKN